MNRLVSAIARLFFHSFKKHLLSSYQVHSTVLGTLNQSSELGSPNCCPLPLFLFSAHPQGNIGLILVTLQGTNGDKMVSESIQSVLGLVLEVLGEGLMKYC
jgi:hypothetical protein